LVEPVGLEPTLGNPGIARQVLSRTLRNIPKELGFEFRVRRE